MSSKLLTIPARALALLGLAVAGTAAGQTAPPPAPERTVGERFDAAVGGAASTRDGLSALVTGYEDLILLQKRRFFTAWASVSPQYTSNAALTPDEESDFFAVASAGLRAETVLADTVNVHAEAGVLSSRYQDLDELDYSALTGSLGADRDFATPLGRVNVGADWSPAWLFSRGFGDKKQTRHRLSATTRLVKGLAEFKGLADSEFASQALLVPSITVERLLTDPSDYEYTGASIDISLLWRPSRVVQYGAAVGAYVRDYDDYFEGIVGDSRRDDGLRAVLFLQWTPVEHLAVNVGADYTTNNSSSDVNEYDSWSFSPGATIDWRF